MVWVKPNEGLQDMSKPKKKKGRRSKKKKGGLFGRPITTELSKSRIGNQGGKSTSYAS